MSLGDDKFESKEEIEKYLEEKKRLETLFHEKFTKILTVMFTDLKGSTSIAEAMGDIETRMLIKHHTDIVLPIIKKHNGVLIKTIGDGTFSSFEKAQDGVRAAAQIQKGIDDFNVRRMTKNPLLIRIGLHTGNCIVEKNNIFGDVVNTASRFEASANPGDIYISEETYEAMSDKAEIYCRFIKTITFMGKKEPVKVYKVFWNKSEITEKRVVAEKPHEATGEEKHMAKSLKLALIILVPLILVFLYLQATKMVGRMDSAGDRRSVRHSVETQEEVNHKERDVSQKQP